MLVDVSLHPYFGDAPFLVCTAQPVLILRLPLLHEDFLQRQHWLRWSLRQRLHQIFGCDAQLVIQSILARQRVTTVIVLDRFRRMKNWSAHAPVWAEETAT